MPNFKFHGNLPTILVYAWICSRQDLRAAVLPEAGEPWSRKDGQQVIAALVEHEVGQVAAASPCGRLLRLETSALDLQVIDATLRESSGIYFNAEQEADALAERVEGGNEPASLATGIFLAWLDQDPQLAWLLAALGEVHRGDQAGAAQALSLFFQGQSQLALRSRPFFVGECVRLALERVEWSRVAEHLQSVPHTSHRAASSSGLSATQADGAAIVKKALFAEALRLTGLEFREWAGQAAITEDARTMAHFLADFCRQSEGVVTYLASAETE